MFRDRESAGRLLADRLLSDQMISEVEKEEVLLLSLPRGGVVIGVVVAERLGCDQDVLISKKISHPNSPELAFGAIAEDGEAILSSRYESLSSDEIDQQIGIAQRKVKGYVEKFRGGRELYLEGKKLVVVVDDGVATGKTALAAVKWLRDGRQISSDEFQIILAVPVGARSSVEELREVADKVICLDERDDLMAVGQFYEKFNQVSDDEVLELLHD